MVNLELKFLSGDSDEGSRILCEKFNRIDPDDLKNFTLGYVYDLDLFKNDKFDWNSHLSDAEPMSCDVYYCGVNIGSVSLIHYRNTKFFNVKHNKNVAHTPELDEYNFWDKYYLVSEFKNGQYSYKFEIAHDHPYREVKGCIPCNRKSYNCPFSWSFNGIIKSQRSLNYLFAQNLDDSDNDEEEAADYKKYRGKFTGYEVKNANFEDAVKSLLLFHLLVNNAIGDFDEKYFGPVEPDDVIFGDFEMENLDSVKKKTEPCAPSLKEPNILIKKESKMNNLRKGAYVAGIGLFLGCLAYAAKKYLG